MVPLKFRGEVNLEETRVMGLLCRESCKLQVDRLTPRIVYSVPDVKIAIGIRQMSLSADKTGKMPVPLSIDAHTVELTLQ